LNVGRLVCWMDDLMNPVVVKELRQAVQGRFVMGVMLLFLLVSVGAIGLAAMNAGDDLGDLDTGRLAFMFFMMILMCACLVMIPVYIGGRMTLERAPDQTDLMYATTLTPGALIRGKVLCGFFLAILIYSLCMPFMTLTYLLRGVDLPSIFALLGIGLVVSACANQVTIFVACLPVAKWLKTVLGLGVIIGLISAVSMMSMMSQEVLRSGIQWSTHWRMFWAPVLSCFGGAAMAVGLLHVVSVAMITPGTANRALVVRIYVTLSTVISMILLTVWAVVERTIEFLFPLLVVFVPIFCVSFLAGISERRNLGPRIRRTIPRHALLRIPTFFFYSGAGSGIIWSLLMLALILGYCGLWSLWPWIGSSMRKNPDFDLSCFYALVVSLYIVGYGFSGLILQRTILKSLIKPALTWGVSFIVMIVFCLTPMIVAFFLKVDFNYRHGVGWFFGNPFALVMYRDDYDFFKMISISFSTLTFLANLPWLVNRIRQFKPLKNEPAIQAAE
jgi:hypothetical protein